MFKYIIIAILIILVICLIYYIVTNTDSAKRTKFKKCLSKSVGVYDIAARQALNILTRIDNPTADDYFNRGHILRFNVLEGDTDLQTRQTRNIIAGIARDYTDALVRITQDQPENPEFMIYQIEDFGRTANGFNRADFANDNDFAEILAALGNAIANEAPIVKRETTEKRLETAIAATDNKKDAIDKFFKDSTKYTSNAQNVHDSKVNSDLRQTLAKLRSTAGGVNPEVSIEEAREYIAAKYSKEHPRKVDAALRGLDTAARGEFISTYDDTEANIFALTWERTKNNRNKENADLMKEAVIHSLADGIEKGTQVCINGRCSRILGSLATLDYDRDLSSAMTFEAYRNQIYQETDQIFNRVYNSYKGSTDPDKANVAKYLDGESENINEDLLTEFRNNVKSEVDNNLEQYKEKFSQSEFEGVKAECHIAVDI